MQQAWAHQAWVAARYATWVAMGSPAAYYWWAALTHQLGANPAEALIRALGEWTLIALCLTLTVSPAARWLATPVLMQWRRGLGLLTFAYAIQHMGTYVWLDMESSVWRVWDDVWERPFIAVGMAALVLMTPLAATSFRGAMQRLGPVRWKALHRAVYAVAALGVLHFYWMRSGKNDYADVWIYGVWLAIVLLLRLAWYRRQAKRRLAVSPTRTSHVHRP